MLDWVAQPSLRQGDATQIPLYLQKAKDDACCLADLSDARWVGPATLVALAAFLDRQLRNGRSIRVVRPKNADLSRYISRMGFGRLLDQLRVQHDLPVVMANSDLNSRSLVELSRFSNEAEVADLIAILTYSELPGELRDAMCDVLSEMGNNVPDHARVENGFMAAQVVNGGRTLTLSVADSGVGMLGTLRSQGATTDRHAISLALDGTSETRMSGRGRGIPSMKVAVQTHRGRANILSGKSMVTISRGTDAYFEHRIEFSGTVFDASLPLST